MRAQPLDPPPVPWGPLLWRLGVVADGAPTVLDVAMRLRLRLRVRVPSAQLSCTHTQHAGILSRICCFPAQAARLQQPGPQAPCRPSQRALTLNDDIIHPNDDIMNPLPRRKKSTSSRPSRGLRWVHVVCLPSGGALCVQNYQQPKQMQTALGPHSKLQSADGMRCMTPDQLRNQHLQNVCTRRRGAPAAGSCPEASIRHFPRCSS